MTLTVDDTLARHTGKHIASGGMHRDPLLSTAKKPYFHFGHNWVVLSLVFGFPAWRKVFSLPVLVRLYRPKKVNKKLGLPHRKKTEMASEMIQLLAQASPNRKFRTPDLEQVSEGGVAGLWAAWLAGYPNIHFEV